MRTTATRYELFDGLTNEQQDHLFCALHDAREAVRERWLLKLGVAIPARVERVFVEQYAEQLKDEAAERRAAYASVCAAAGIEIRKVSRWMGHANINTTDSIYTHLFNGSHDEDMDRLDAAAERSSEVLPLRAISN